MTSPQVPAIDSEDREATPALKACRVCRESRGPQGLQGAPGKDGVSGYTVVHADQRDIMWNGWNDFTLVVGCPGGLSPVGGGFRAGTGTTVIASMPDRGGWRIDGRNTEDPVIEAWVVCVQAS